MTSLEFQLLKCLLILQIFRFYGPALNNVTMDYENFVKNHNFVSNNMVNKIFCILKVGSVAGIALILVAGIIQGRLYPEVFEASWRLWFAAIIFTPMGFCLGFLISSIARFKYHIRRTIGIETGIQNAGVALSIIAMTFQGAETARYSIFPLVFAAFQMVSGFALVIVYRIYFRIMQRRKRKYQMEDIDEIFDKEKALADEKEKEAYENGGLVMNGRPGIKLPTNTKRPEAVPSVSAYVPYVPPKARITTET